MSSNSENSYEQAVQHMAQRIAAVSQEVQPQLGRLSIWIRFVRVELFDGSPVEMTEGSTTRIILEINRPAELITLLAENIVMKVFGEELRPTRGIPEVVLKLFDEKYYLPPEGPYADAETELKLKVTVYKHRPGLFETLFGLGDDDEDRSQ